jgi:hypothetical protein
MKNAQRVNTQLGNALVFVTACSGFSTVELGGILNRFETLQQR